MSPGDIPPIPSTAKALAGLIQDYFDRVGQTPNALALSQLTGLKVNSIRNYIDGNNLPRPAAWAKLGPLLVSQAEPPQRLFTPAPEPQGNVPTGKTGTDENPSTGASEPAVTTPDARAVETEPEFEDWSKAEDRQEFYLPVHGFVWFFPEEVAIINHAAFQRLRNVMQLGLAHFVFPGTTHTRFEHTLGTVWAAHQMVEATTHNCKKKDTNRDPLKVRYFLGSPPSCFEHRFIRLAALLHDIGHLPSGHSIEDELHLLDYVDADSKTTKNKHDGERRLRMVFDKTEWQGQPCDSLRSLIDYNFNRYLPSKLKQVGLSASDVALLIILKAPPADLLQKFGSEGQSKADLTTSLEETLAKAELRLGVCRDIVANTICADILDYLHRDWYHVGKPRFFDQRIFHYMEIRAPRDNGALGIGHPPPSHRDHFVISVGYLPKLRTDGVSAILDLLESRYQLAETVLFHKTKLKATAMLERTLSLAVAERNRNSNVTESMIAPLETWLLSTDDQSILRAIVAGDPTFTPKSMSANAKVRSEAAKKVASKLLVRDLHERLLVVTHDELGSSLGTVQSTYADGVVAASNRESALRQLEFDFDLPVGALSMYCPESRMNRKIADVKLYVEGSVMPFRLLDKAGELSPEETAEWGPRPMQNLSGGHLSAQLDRFAKLWRVGFYIDTDLKRDYGENWDDLKLELTKAIRLCVLGMYHAGESVTVRASEIVKDLLQKEWFKHKGRTALAEAKPAVPAREGADSGAGAYPNGLPSLLRFLE